MHCLLCNFNRNSVNIKFKNKNEAISFFVKSVATYCMSDRSKKIRRTFCHPHLSIYSEHFWIKSNRIMSSGINAIMSVLTNVNIILYIDPNATPWIYNKKEISEEQFIEKVLVLEFGAEHCREFKKFLKSILPILIAADSKVRNKTLCNNYLKNNSAFYPVNIKRLDTAQLNTAQLNTAQLNTAQLVTPRININPSLPNVMHKDQSFTSLINQRLIEAKISELKAKEDEIKKKNIPAITHEKMLKESHEMISGTKKMISDTNKLLESTRKLISDSNSMIEKTNKMIASTRHMLAN
jgi:hypothetical protein